MSKTPPTASQKMAIFQKAILRGETESMARYLARTNTPAEYKQLERYVELIESGMDRKKAADIVNLRPHEFTRIFKQHPDYLQKVEEARHRYMESLVDQIPTLGEGAETPVELGIARLKADNYKWLASKYMPKQFGDRMAIEVEHKINLSNVLLEAESRIIPVVGSVVTEVEQQLIGQILPINDATSEATDADAEATFEDAIDTNNDHPYTMSEEDIFS